MIYEIYPVSKKMNFFIRYKSIIAGSIIGIGTSIYTFVPTFEQLKRETSGTFILSDNQTESNLNTVSNKKPASEKASS
ncbi:uncharacterized protein OCT59_009549 [Rhizophagus irregularis]|uniref:Uncharacterized protein n=1 Tax=Rhizophagus irregularis (strain DAOM 197198w) TaxID=1432141 RepID=A0A015IXA9_RHIIW|nr:hypothetical protein RirG_193040 [Rhizophagus irregularis DAOM 197198w]UZO18229.1 hypothetical protein OCT59_009549 [Rhizophagus irregularis]GBC25094.2 hypothetical protein RIR_jg1466.t1 [Rhizophagus irregularis DAOM 181602=DAOM 197198]